MGQISAAEQMVIIPLSTFKRLAEEAGDPGNVAQFKKKLRFHFVYSSGNFASTKVKSNFQ
jgi:hypothetical protein